MVRKRETWGCAAQSGGDWNTDSEKNVEIALTSSSNGTIPCPLPIPPDIEFVGLGAFGGTNLVTQSDIWSSRAMLDKIG